MDIQIHMLTHAMPLSVSSYRSLGLCIDMSMSEHLSIFICLVFSVSIFLSLSIFPSAFL